LVIYQLVSLERDSISDYDYYPSIDSYRIISHRFSASKEELERFVAEEGEKMAAWGRIKAEYDAQFKDYFIMTLPREEEQRKALCRELGIMAYKRADINLGSYYYLSKNYSPPTQYNCPEYRIVECNLDNISAQYILAATLEAPLKSNVLQTIDSPTD